MVVTHLSHLYLWAHTNQLVMLKGPPQSLPSAPWVLTAVEKQVPQVINESAKVRWLGVKVSQQGGIMRTASSRIIPQNLFFFLGRFKKGLEGSI